MNGREITFILTIVICFEMGKPFSLLYFSTSETRQGITEKCLHRRTGAKTGQDRASGETQGSRCWNKQQEEPSLATQRSPVELFHCLSTGPVLLTYSSVPQTFNHVVTDTSPFSCHCLSLLIWHSVLWLSLDMMDTHPSVHTTVSGHRWASPFLEHIWWDAAGEYVACVPQAPAVAVWPIVAQRLAAVSSESHTFIWSSFSSRRKWWCPRIKRHRKTRVQLPPTFSA